MQKLDVRGHRLESVENIDGKNWEEYNSHLLQQNQLPLKKSQHRKYDMKWT